MQFHNPHNILLRFDVAIGKFRDSVQQFLNIDVIIH